MTDWCIVVADGARARLFTARLPEGANAANLQERQDLVEPERNVPGRELWSDVKSGRNKPGRGYAAFGYDDHRSRHREEVERRFAKRIAAAVANLVRREAAELLVVVAEPRLLGMLRGPLDDVLPGTVPRLEIGADLTWHALPRLQAVLERHGALPARVPGALFRAPASQPPAEAPSPPRLPRPIPSRDNGRPRRRRAA